MKRPLILGLVVFLMGCATGYHSVGYTGGYSDMKVQDDIFKVSFSGNAYTNGARAADLALLRAAEVSRGNGYKYFVIMGEDSDVTTASYTTPVTAQTTGSSFGTINTYGYGYGNSSGTYHGTYSGTTQYSGGQTYHFNKPSTSLMIKCFKEKPENISGMVYDAEQIEANLKKAYGIKN